MTTRTQRILKQNVVTDALLGADALPLGEARQPATQPEPLISEPMPKRTQSLPQRTTSTPHRPAPTATPLLSDPEPAVYASPLPRERKVALLRELDESEVRICVKCVLHEQRTQTVFGEGDPDARLLFIGEGPGQTEDELGRPFVGKAGELLDKQIAAMGLTRGQVYIANAVKCRPPQNRTPTPAEVAACWDYLRRQIATVQPGVIVTLGGPAAKLMLNTQTGITALRGQWHRYDGLLDEGGPSIPVMPTFHPAYLLRSYTPENRKKVWNDLQAVMRVLGLSRG